LEVADWVHRAQDGDWWQAVVNTVSNVLVTKRAGKFLTSSVTSLLKKNGMELVVFISIYSTHISE
jgi:hypothetical protein